MKYEKPEVTKVDSACAAVQGVGKGHGAVDQSLNEPSIAAYEADE